MRRAFPLLLSLLLATPPARGEVAAPQLKWQHGGCHASWCETGWYASPAIADLDGDGAAEVVASAYSVVVLEGATGALRWRVASGHDRSAPGASNVGRTWPGIVVADLDGDGAPEIATAHGGGWVSVYGADGFFEPGWPRQPVTQELRSLAAGDLDRDGTLELALGAARGSATNAWVLEHDGELRAGWPQVDGGVGYAWGVYNDTVALADLVGDAALEVVVPSDVHYICAYDADGGHLAAGAAYGGDPWGEVGVWESHATELRGWGMCNGVRAESYRTNFADGPASVADLDRDGAPEVVATGRTYDCTGGETTKYTGVYVFAADRARWVTADHDWTVTPVDLGAPLSLDYGVIESASYNPALADLDGDGELEILFADFAGKLHAFGLDGQPHGAFPYAIYPGSGPFRFASRAARAVVGRRAAPRGAAAGAARRADLERRARRADARQPRRRPRPRAGPPDRLLGCGRLRLARLGARARPLGHRPRLLPARRHARDPPPALPRHLRDRRPRRLGDVVALSAAAAPSGGHSPAWAGVAFRGRSS